MYSKFQELVVIIILISGPLISQIGLSQGLASILSVESHFEIESGGELAWSVGSYALSQGTFFLIAGKLGDMYGHKKLFIIGLFWFCFWSLLTTITYFASSPVYFFIFRGFQGLGSAFVIPNAVAILALLYEPGHEKTIVFAIFGAAQPVGFALGSVMGAFFTRTDNWFWMYFFTFGICALLTMLGFVFIPTDKKNEKINEPEDDSFDLLGAFTGVLGNFLFNAAWNVAGQKGWDKPYTIVLFLVGLICLIWFIFIEIKSRNPLIPVNQLSASVLRVLICVGCGFAAFGIWLYYIWTFMLVVRENSPLQSAGQFSPVAITGCLAVVFTSFLCVKEIHINIIMITGLICILIPSILLATVPESQSYWVSLFVSVLFAPFFVVICSSAATLLMSNVSSHTNQGISAALVATMNSISFGLGTAGVAVEYTEPESDMEAVRVAAYVGIGFCGLGILVAMYGLISDFLYIRKNSKPEAEVDSV